MTQPTLFGDTLAEARDELQEKLDEGTTCACCGQFAKVYRRTITSATARVLIEMYRRRDEGWLDVPRLGVLTAGRGDECKARYWGLIEPEPHAQRDDGSTRTGSWRLTAQGRAFVRGRLSVPKYARVYDGTCLGLDGDPITITDALGTRFNYAELMAGI